MKKDRQLELDEQKVAEVKAQLEKDPENAKLWYDLGKLHFESDFQTARECFSRAIALDPFNGEYVFSRGWKALSADCYEEAMADFQLAIRLAPVDGFKWHYLANSYFFLGNYEKAAENYFKAIEMHKKTGTDLIPPAVDWIWMCYQRLGKKEEAKQVLADYITPDMPVDDSDFVYKKRVLLYAGYTSLDDFVADINQEDSIDVITENYAASSYCNFILGDKKRAMEFVDKALAVPEGHHAFGYKLAKLDKEKGLV